MSGRLYLLLTIVASTLFAQKTNDLPFQVLIANNALIYGNQVEPLQMVDDVTSIEIGDEGFVCLVHKGGTTYEIEEKTFTFYLKHEQLKNRMDRPPLEILWMDSALSDQSTLITVLHPPFDRSGYLIWNENEPFKVYWHLKDEPVINYMISVSDKYGNKIQDFRTRHHEYELNPATFGLSDPLFTFQVSSTFGGETISSKNYSVGLKNAPLYESKASDYVLKALDLELSPLLALGAWQEVLGMPNGKEYFKLFEKFLIRNKTVLTAAGEDVQLLLSQNR